MEMIDTIAKRQSDKFSQKFEELVLARLKEMGYDTTKPKSIAQRCTLVIKEETPKREIWVDYEQDNAQLIAVYTDPVFKFEKEEDVFKGIMEFTFTPLPTAESATVQTRTNN